MDIFDEVYDAVVTAVNEGPEEQREMRVATLEMHAAVKPLIDAEKFDHAMRAVENLLASVLMTACPCCREELVRKLAGHALHKANDLTAVYEASHSMDEEVTKGETVLQPQNSRLH